MTHTAVFHLSSLETREQPSDEISSTTVVKATFLRFNLTQVPCQSWQDIRGAAKLQPQGSLGMLSYATPGKPNQKLPHLSGRLARVVRCLAAVDPTTRPALGVGELAAHVALESRQNRHLSPLVHVG